MKSFIMKKNIFTYISLFLYKVMFVSLLVMISTKGIETGINKEYEAEENNLWNGNFEGYVVNLCWNKIIIWVIGISSILLTIPRINKVRFKIIIPVILLILICFIPTKKSYSKFYGFNSNSTLTYRNIFNNVIFTQDFVNGNPIE